MEFLFIWLSLIMDVQAIETQSQQICVSQAKEAARIAYSGCLADLKDREIELLKKNYEQSIVILKEKYEQDLASIKKEQQALRQKYYKNSDLKAKKNQKTINTSTVKNINLKKNSKNQIHKETKPIALIENLDHFDHNSHQNVFDESKYVIKFKKTEISPRDNAHDLSLPDPIEIDDVID